MLPGNQVVLHHNSHDQKLLRTTEKNYFYLPSDGTRGGILLAAKESCMTLSNPELTNHTISASVLDHRLNKS
jgi:hypothetical protein